MYGKANFDFSILSICNENERLDVEQYYIDKMRSSDPMFGYNIVDDVDNPFCSENMLKHINESIRGENHYANIYSEKQVKELISYLLTGNYSYVELSNMLGISYDVIASIASHDSWQYLTNGLVFPKANKSTRSNVKLKEDDIPKIIDMINQNMTNNDISKKFGVHPKTISDIRNHKTWKEFTDGMEFPKSPKYSEPTGLQQNIIKYFKKDINISKNIIAKETGASISMVWATFYKYKETM